MPSGIEKGRGIMNTNKRHIIKSLHQAVSRATRSIRQPVWIETLETRRMFSSISGIVWQDRNGDGGKDSVEPGLSGRTVYIDADDDGVLDAGETTRTSAADGSYAF